MAINMIKFIIKGNASIQINCNHRRIKIYYIIKSIPILEIQLKISFCETWIPKMLYTIYFEIFSWLTRYTTTSWPEVQLLASCQTECDTTHKLEVCSGQNTPD